MKKSLVLGLDKDQKRKEKPALVAQLTLLDIVANGTSIRLFRETAVSFDKNTFTRYVMNVRQPAWKRLGGISKNVAGTSARTGFDGS